MCNFKLGFEVLNELRNTDGDLSYMTNYTIIRAFQEDGLVSYEALGTSEKELKALCLRGAIRAEKELIDLARRVSMRPASTTDLLSLIHVERENIKKLEDGHDIL